MNNWKYERPDVWHENCWRRLYERLRAENERLKHVAGIVDLSNRVVSDLHDAQAEIEELREESKRLRGLLKKFQAHVEVGMVNFNTELREKVEKELRDGQVD